jgi:membrane protease YdiL (CAAX protease family)
VKKLTRNKLVYPFENYNHSIKMLSKKTAPFSRMNNKFNILFYCAAVEICYLSISFALGEWFGQWSYVGEAIRTGLRLVVIVFYGHCYRRYFFDGQQPKHSKNYFAPSFIAAVFLLFLFAAHYTNAENETLLWQLVFAVSGIFAGIREELFYRGFVQQHFQVKYGNKSALLMASAAFTLSHVQYIYHSQLSGLLFIALAGIIFGSIFIYTRNIVVTAIIHGLYDAILSINISLLRLNVNSALAVLSLIMLMFLVLIYKELNAKIEFDFGGNNQDNLNIG